MVGVNLKVGLSIDNVKEIANKSNVSEEIRTLIFDFCEKDFDKKITDDIELHILKTWLSGEKRVTMPNLKKSSIWSGFATGIKILFGQNVALKHNVGDIESIETYEIGFGGLCNLKNRTQSSLFDIDRNGYAELYQTTDKNCPKGRKEALVND
jgi:hypothetical protein